VKTLDFKNLVFVFLVKILASLVWCIGLSVERVPGGIVLTKNLKRKGVAASPSQIPPSNFDNIALVMEYFTCSRRDAVFVQVGANDGQTSDSVHPFVKRGVLRSYLIEPIPDLFKKLNQFYEGISNTILINAAIGRSGGEQIIYKVADKGRWQGNVWAAQLATFDHSQMLRMGIREEEIEKVRINTLTLQDLVVQFNLGQINVLQIDTEGYDAEIVRSAMELEHLPQCICFEHAHFGNALPQKEVTDLYELLTQKGYYWSHDRLNTMAIHSSFIPTGKPETRSASQGKKL
jgi:FkbM family methyltransferase